MSRRLAIVALAIAACSPASADRDPPREPPQPPSFEHEAMVRYHMQRHYDDLRTVERMLVNGYFDEAKALSFTLTKSEQDAGMKPWVVESRELVDAARALAASRDIGDALHRVTQVSAACARCHLATQRVPVFAKPSKPPLDQPITAARMARHSWAVDRLWEGMVAGSDEHWRAGLDVLATTALPNANTSPGERLRTLAKTALERRVTSTLEERATSYAEMLRTCAGCHATFAKKSR